MKTTAYVMLRYQQKIDRRMALIGYSYGMSGPNNEAEFKVQFKQSRQSIKTGNLTIFNVLESDSAVYYCAAGSCKGVLITQWPGYISSLKSTSVDMHCYQNDTDYDYTYWYRQTGKEIVLIARYVAGTSSHERGFENGFKVWGTKKQWSLTVDVEEGSSAVYLCAASHHRIVDSVDFQQDPHLFIRQTAKAKIPCSHNDGTLTLMLWYRQERDDTNLTLIGYGYSSGNPTYEPGFSERFEMTRQGRANCSPIQQISSVIANESGDITIQCSHDNTNLQLMLWYQKNSNRAMALIGFTYGASGETLTVQVLQDTSSLMAISGSTISFHCTIEAKFSINSYTMQWYKQEYYSKPLEFLMMEYEQATKKMNVVLVKDENKFSLHISELTLQDSAIYYCAARHSEAKVKFHQTGNLT
ncbi:hypothetical protein Baya_6144 [Bagarius yarrelli]|uniref:Ig-like domain-containing protein n=1 Tax=Bagarius yarrelli TaxID=175774 RepID=A0A556U561_BAGYA|nr:hypothetical protein Baya_6144 [Bagarius yarrelli]